jgi:hypothetical protein
LVGRGAVRWDDLGCREWCRELVRDCRRAEAHDFPWEAEDGRGWPGASRQLLREPRRRDERQLVDLGAPEVALRDAKEHCPREFAPGAAEPADLVGRQRE